MDKKECRNTLQRQWESLSDADLREMNQRICRTIISSKDWIDSGKILAYLSFKAEISLDDLILESIKKGKEVFVPRIQRGGIMNFHRIETLEPASLELNYWGIREPLEDSELFDETPYRAEQTGSPPPLKLLILTPGLGFTEDGKRMGRGGGFYDRFLTGMKENEYCVTMGIAWEGIIIPEIPSESHDRKIRKLCNGSEIIDCQSLN